MRDLNNLDFHDSSNQGLKLDINLVICHLFVFSPISVRWKVRNDWMQNDGTR